MAPDLTWIFAFFGLPARQRRGGHDYPHPRDVTIPPGLSPSPTRWSS